jgi:titin
VESGSTYSYYVTASNSLHEGQPSAIVDVVPCGVPSVPLNLTIAPGDGEVVLQWSAPENEGGMPLVGYNLYTGMTLASLEFDSYIGYKHSLTLGDLTNGQEYFFAVSAVNELGEGALSDHVSTVPLGLPGAPRDLITGVSKSTVTLSWIPPEDNGGSPITGYVLLRATSPDDLDIVTTLGVVGNYTDIGLERGNTYFYALRAVTAVGEGPLTGPVQASVAAPEEDGGAGLGLLIAIVVIIIVIAVIALFITLRKRGPAAPAEHRPGVPEPRGPEVLEEKEAEKEGWEEEAPTPADDIYGERKPEEYEDGWVSDD